MRSDTGFEQRLATLEPDLRDTVARVFGADAAPEVTRSLVEVARAAHAARPAELHALDERRLRDPDWFQRPAMVGYAAYADRFAGDAARGGRARVVPAWSWGSATCT